MNQTFWKRIIAADFAVPPVHTVMGLTPELLGYLGAPDPDLRDEIAYTILAAWITRGRYTPDDLRLIRDQMTRNLLAGLGEQNHDRVFLRSFSALVLAVLVYYDNRQPVFSDAEIMALDEQALAYLAGERDLRGWVPGKGWAHALAHTADWIDELALHRGMDAPRQERLLTALRDKVIAPSESIYTHDEDERLVTAVISALRRDQVSGDFLRGWLEPAAGLRARMREKPFQYAHYGAYMNTKHFVRSLYFRLALADDLPAALREWLPDVLAVVKALNG